MNSLFLNSWWHLQRFKMWDCEDIFKNVGQKTDAKIFTLDHVRTVKYVCLDPKNSPRKHVQRGARYAVHKDCFQWVEREGEYCGQRRERHGQLQHEEHLVLQPQWKRWTDHGRDSSSSTHCNVGKLILTNNNLDNSLWEIKKYKIGLLPEMFYLFVVGKIPVFR